MNKLIFLCVSALVLLSFALCAEYKPCYEGILAMKLQDKYALVKPLSEASSKEYNAWEEDVLIHKVLSTRYSNAPQLEASLQNSFISTMSPLLTKFENNVNESDRLMYLTSALKHWLNPRWAQKI